MRALCRLATLTMLLLPALVPAASRADAISDPLGFQFSAPQLTVDESAGQAVITVSRSAAESLMAAQVRYISSGDGYNPATNGPFDCSGTPCTAVSDIDFTSVKGELDFAAGQTSAQFTVPIVDHSVDTAPKTIQLGLFGPSPIGLAAQAHTVLEIVNDDAIATAAVASDPLGLPGVGSATDPLAGARFFVDPESEAASAAQRYSALNVIAQQPGTARFGKFSTSSPYVPNIATAVSRYLSRAEVEAPGTVPLLATYALVHGVRGNGDPPSFVAWYQSFISGLAQGSARSPR